MPYRNTVSYQSFLETTLRLLTDAYAHPRFGALVPPEGALRALLIIGWSEFQGRALSQSDLAREIGFSQSRFQRVVTWLRRNQLVAFHPIAGDRRAVTPVLTQNARGVLDDLHRDLVGTILAGRERDIGDHPD